MPLTPEEREAVILVLKWHLKQRPNESYNVLLERALRKLEYV